MIKSFVTVKLVPKLSVTAKREKLIPDSKNNAKNVLNCQMKKKLTAKFV